MVLQLIFSGVVLGSIYSLFGVGLVILYRGTTLLNFGQGELFMLGAYLLFAFNSLLHLNYLTAMLLSIMILLILGGALSKLIFQQLFDAPHLYQVLAACGFIFVFQGIARVLWGSDIRFISPLIGRRPTEFMGIMVTSQEVIILISVSIFTIIFTLIFLYTKSGKMMQAASQSLRGASLIGMNVMNFQTVIWIVSAGIAAIAGIMVGPLISVMPEMGGDILIKAFAAMTLGGFGSIPGALLGGLLMGIIENITAFYISSTLREISAFFIIIVILLVKPTGIMGVKLK
jgi:branched-chain amino acid transport system permease protein